MSVDRAELPLIASNYYLRRTVVSAPLGAWVQIAAANPARWHLAILWSFPNNFFASPFAQGAIPEGIFFDGSLILWECNFRDSPALCTAAWQAQSAGLGPAPVEVWETIPVGS